MMPLRETTRVEHSKVPAVIPQKDCTAVVKVNRTARGGIRLQFADQFAKTMSLKKLGLSADGIVWATLRAFDGGIRISASFGPPVILDGATLRYLADPAYASAVNDESANARIPNDKLRRLAAKHSFPHRRNGKPRRRKLARTTRR